MKVIHASIALFFMGFVISCTTPDIRAIGYDFDTKVDFANLKNYDWMQLPNKENIDSFTVIRVKKAVNAELQARGLRMTPDNPDFLIAEHLGSKDKIDVKNWGYRNRDRRSDRVVTHQYEEGSLTLDFVDANSKTLIWSGAAKANIYSVLTPEEREKLINEAVRRILQNFPPPPPK